MAGLRVTEVEREADGRATVWAVTASTPSCPRCEMVPEHVHEYVVTRPRDVRHGVGQMEVCLVKRRWECESQDCPQQTFTESLPQVPTRCRITRRLREQAGTEIMDRGITRPRRLGMPGCPGRSRMTRSPLRRTRCWSSRPGR